MGLLKRKINIRKEVQGDDQILYIDYHKLNSPIDFITGLLKTFINEQRCIAVIDTKLSYKPANTQADTKELYRYLEKQNIVNRSVVLQEDRTEKYLGIQITLDHKKSEHHKIAMLLSKEEIEAPLRLNSLNIHFFIGLHSEASEELLDRFQAAHGETDELSKCCNYQIYVDHFMSSIKLVHRKDITDEVLGIINSHINSWNK